MSLLAMTLKDGTRISATAIHVQATYAHLYEGLPGPESNDRYLTDFPQRVERIFHGPSPVYVIESDRRKTDETYMGREVEHLPPYWCAAEFYEGSFGAGPVTLAMATCLVVVWFQYKPFPIPSVRAKQQLESLNWNKHAEPFEL